MRTIRTLLLLVCLAVMSAAWANPLNVNQAKTIAANFMATKSMPKANFMLATRAPRLGGATSAGSNAAYYVFNAAQSQGGFVIIAGDDRVPAVLGYSDRGYYNPDDVPEALQELLDSYSQQIAALDQGAEAAPALKAMPAVGPLLPCVWSQGNPYNIRLPFLPKGEHAATGCVATAAAQVMYYWRWPQRPIRTIPAYTSETLSIYMPALPTVNFNWEAMRSTYLTTDTTSESAQAVAQLMLYCAQAYEMDFMESSSSANGSRAGVVLSNYFGYKESAHALSRVNYSTQQWADIIYNELQAKRPVIYNASKKNGGHSFVCDGYDGNGLFHINWGWNGSSNGYFLLNVLNPDNQGTGGASGSYAYIYTQSIIVGLEPGTDSAWRQEITAALATLQSYTSTRYASNGEFTATVSCRFYNYSSQTFSGYYGWGLFQGDRLVEEISKYRVNSLRPGYYMSKEETLRFGSTVSTGNFRIMPMFSLNGTSWTPCVGSDRNYFDVEIYYNSCIFKAHGTTAAPNYTVNEIKVDGTMHPGRPVNFILNLTNNGESSNKVLNMYVDNVFKAAAFVGLEKGETGDVPFVFSTAITGPHTATFLWEDGNTRIASESFTIVAMPAANLSGTARVLKVTDTSKKIITSDNFSVQLTVRNRGTIPYDEDITVKLYKNIYGNTGTLVQAPSKRVHIEPNQSVTVTFNLDNVIDGWKYFAKSYYYSEGEQVSLAGTSTYTIVFPTPPVKGDVNGDGEVNIADVNAAIDMVLTGNKNERGDVNGDGEINIADINEVINIILKN